MMMGLVSGCRRSLSEASFYFTKRSQNYFSAAPACAQFMGRLPQSVRGSEHSFKYRLALVVDGICVLRFDNEAGKGDHKHVANTEEPYKFNGPEALLEDFWSEVDKWRR